MPKPPPPSTRSPGVKQQGVRAGNWLTKAQAEALINCPDPSTLKGKRDRALLALLVGCGLRRGEAVALTVADIQQRDGRWVIVDLRGKHGRVRTIPVPAWVKQAVDLWLRRRRRLPRGGSCALSNRHGQITGSSLSPQAVLAAVRFYGEQLGWNSSPTTSAAPAPSSAAPGAGNSNRSSCCSATPPYHHRTLPRLQTGSRPRPNDRIGLHWRED